MMQVLTEAGWSVLAYDHSWRNPQYFDYVMLYFCFMHIIIDYIIGTLIKGIFWEVYFTVDKIFKEREKETLEEEIEEEELKRKVEEVEGIKKMIEEKEFIVPNTVLRREIVENSLDEKIFKRLAR